MTTMAPEAPARERYGHVPPPEPMGGSRAQQVGRQVQSQRATAERRQQAMAFRQRQQRRQTFRRAVPTRKAQMANYQPVILAEFVAAIILVAATPIATKKKGSTASPLSPYGVTEMVQLAALTIAYFILALLSVGGRTPGRFAAWFGGLLLLGVGLGEAASIAKTLDLFGTSAPGPSAGVARGSAGSLIGNVGGPQNTGAAPTATGA